MADIRKDAEVDIGLDLEIRKAVSAAEMFAKGFEKSLVVLAKNEEMVRKLRAELEKFQKVADKANSSPTKNMIRARQFTDLGITQGNYTSDQITARVTQEVLKQQQRLARTQSEAVAAQMRKFQTDMDALIRKFGTEAATQLQRNRNELRQAQDEFTYGRNLEGTRRRQALQQAMMSRASDVDAVALRNARDIVDRRVASSRPINEDVADRALTSLLRRNRRSLTTASGVGISLEEAEGTLNRGGVSALDALVKERLAQAAALREQTRIDREASRAINQAAKDEVAQRNRATRDRERAANEEFKMQQTIRTARRAGLDQSAIDQFVASGDRRGMVLASMDARDAARAARVERPSGGIERRARSFGDRISARAELAADYTAIGGTFGLGFAAVNEIAKFDDALARFAGITETSNTEMEGFRSTLLKVAQTSRASVSELAEVAIVLGQTGLSASEVTKALKPIADLSLASGSTLKETSDVITGVLGAFQIDASRTSEVANLMAASLNQTKLNMQQLALGIQYAGNIANDAGLTFTELTAVLGTMANAGIRAGSTLGTGTRQLIQELIAPSDKLKNLMQQLGISMADIDVKTNGLVGVLENLRSKGFGTAEALSTLDLRAAAAFSALASRTEQTRRLQEVLLLTEASSTAAARASESLLATLQRLGNSIVGILDSAFRPFVEVIKLSANGISGLLNTVNALTAPLGTVGQSLAYVGLMTGGAVAGMVALRAAMGATAAAAAGTAVSVGALNAAGAFLTGPAGWVLGGITLVAGLGAGLMAMGGNASATAKRLDEVGAALNEIKSRESTLQNTLSSLDRAIDQALTKSDRLRRDPIALRTIIVENQKAFAQFGLSIDSQTATIEQLTEALRNLRNELSNDMSGLSSRQVVLGEQRLDLMRQEYGTRFRNARFQALDMIQPRSGLLSRSADQFGGRLDPVLDLLNDPRDLLGSVGQARTASAFGIIQRERSALQGRLATLEPNSAEARNVRALVERLDNLFKFIDEIVTKSRSILGQEKSNELQRSNQSTAEIRSQFLTRNRQTDPLAPVIGLTGSDDITNLEKRLSSQLSGLTGQQGLSSSQLVESYRGIKAAAVLEAQRMSQDLDRFAEELRARGFKETDIKSALSEYRDRLASIFNMQNETIRNAADAISGIETVQDRGEQRTLQSQLQLARRKLQQATTQEEVDQLSQQVTNLVEQEHAVSKRLKERELKRADRNISVAERAEEFQKLEQQKQDSLEEATMNARRRSTEIAAAQLDAVQKRLKTQIDDITSEIEQAERRAKDPRTTRTEAEKLFNRIQELIQQRLQLTLQSIEGEAAKSFLTPGNVGAGGNLAPGSTPSSSAGPGTVARQIIDQLVAAGRPDLIPYALANAQNESSMGRNLQNTTGSSAKGLFGFIDSTWRGLMGGADVMDTGNQIVAFVKYTQQIEQALRNAFPGREISDMDRRLGHHFGSKDAISLLNSPADRRLDDIFGPNVFAQNPHLTPGMTVQQLMQVVGGKLQRGASATNQFLDRGTTLQQQAAVQDSEDARRTAARRAETERERIEQERQDAEWRARRRANQITEAETRARVRQETGFQGRVDDPNMVAESIRRVYEQEKALFDLRTEVAKKDPQNTSNPNAVREVQERTLQEMQQNVLAGLDRMAKASRDRIDTQVKAIENQLEADRLNPTMSRDERASAEERLRVLKLQQTTQVEMLSTQQQLKVLEEVINDLTKNRGASEGEINNLLEKRKELQSRLAQLTPAAAVGSRAPDYSFGAAVDRAVPTRTPLTNFNDLVSDLQQVRGSAISGLGDALLNIATNAKNAGEAFRQFGVSLLQTVGQILSRRIAESLVDSIFGAFGSKAGGQGGGLSGLLGSLMPGKGGTAGAAAGASSIMPFKAAQGGAVPFTKQIRFQRAALGFGVPTRDSVPALLMPGEVVMKRSAVETIGRDKLLEMNAMGNRIQSRSPMNNTTAPSNEGGDKVVNVWVVSQDQLPPPGPNDIIATVAENISQGGTIKQLIRSVNMGTAT